MNRREQIDLRYRTNDIQQRVNSTETLQRVVHNFFRSRRFAQVQWEHQAFSAERLRLLRVALLTRTLSRRNLYR